MHHAGGEPPDASPHVRWCRRRRCDPRPYPINLVTGRREFAAGREFYEGDIADGQLVDRVFREHPDIDAVIHCAALIVVPDSVADPVGYYRANVAKSLEFVAHLLHVRPQHGSAGCPGSAAR